MPDRHRCAFCGALVSHRAADWNMHRKGCVKRAELAVEQLCSIAHYFALAESQEEVAVLYNEIMDHIQG